MVSPGQSLLNSHSTFFFCCLSSSCLSGPGTGTGFLLIKTTTTTTTCTTAPQKTLSTRSFLLYIISFPFFFLRPGVLRSSLKKEKLKAQTVLNTTSLLLLLLPLPHNTTTTPPPPPSPSSFFSVSLSFWVRALLFLLLLFREIFIWPGPRWNNHLLPLSFSWSPFIFFLCCCAVLHVGTSFFPVLFCSLDSTKLMRMRTLKAGNEQK